MMTKTRSTVWAKCKIMFALPAFMVVLFLFSSSSFDQLMAQTESPNAKSGSTKPIVVKADSKSSGQSQTQTSKNETKKQQVKYTTPVVVSDKKTSNGEPYYTVVEQQPTFVGGQDGLIKFLRENIKYPEEALKKGIVGKVFLTFVVMADGKVSDVKILRGVGGGCDEEALRVVKMMPNWNPGTTKGKPVNVEFNLPINFQLDKEAKGEKKK